MLKRFVTCLIATTILAGMLHGHGAPLLGTVTIVDEKANTITIKDKDNKSLVILVSSGTKLLKGDKPAVRSDLKVGVRVVVDAQLNAKANTYTAEEISIGTAVTSATPAKAPAPAKK